MRTGEARIGWGGERRRLEGGEWEQIGVRTGDGKNWLGGDGEKVG